MVNNMCWTVLFYFQGMVEKWLLQVEKLMLKSVQHVIHQGLTQYAEVLFLRITLFFNLMMILVRYN